MTTRLRLMYLAVAVLIALVAAVALGSGGSDGDAARAPESAATPQPTVSAATPPADATPTPAPTPRPRPLGPLLTAGTERTIEVTEGDTVRFRVRHASDEEVHVHGYAISEPLPAGETVRMSFEATIPGIFEIELEGSHVLLARLEVRP